MASAMEVKRVFDTGPNVSKNEYNFKTIVFTALATTGWPTKADPASAKITSLCLVPISVEHLARQNVMPKIVNKLTIYCNPEKEIHPKAAEASGLTNKDLIDFPTFDEQAQMVTSFLKTLPQPIHLVAHQGDIFHFRLLFLHLSQSKDVQISDFAGIFCTDSLKVVKEMAPGLKSKALDELYKGTGREPIVGAEGRCLMLLDIVRGFSTDQLHEFMTLCNTIRCTFSEMRFDERENPSVLGQEEMGRM